MKIKTLGTNKQVLVTDNRLVFFSYGEPVVVADIKEAPKEVYVYIRGDNSYPKPRYFTSKATVIKHIQNFVKYSETFQNELPLKVAFKTFNSDVVTGIFFDSLINI